MLTIPFGHILAALRDVLGEIARLSSVLATRRTSAVALDTPETLPVTAPDQVLVSGLLVSGAPVSIHYRGGMPRGEAGLFWEIDGTEGDLRVSGPSGHAQMVPLALSGGHGEDRTLRTLKVPSSYRSGWPDDVVPGNVARVYARMANHLRNGTSTAPTFDNAVGLHRIITAVEEAAEQYHPDRRPTADRRPGSAMPQRFDHRSCLTATGSLL